MKNKLYFLIPAAVLLLAANILNWTGVFAGHERKDGALKTVNSLNINWQKQSSPTGEKMSKNIFFSSDNNDYTLAGMDGYNGRANSGRQKVTPIPTPPKIWPLFKVSGVALNNGKKCAFFSGPVFSGAVYEGSDINDNYSVSAINGNKVEITDKLTNEKKNYNMEAK